MTLSHFVTADTLEQMVGPIFGPFFYNFVLFLLCSGVGLALWQKVE